MGLPALVATVQTQGSLKSAFVDIVPSAYAQPAAPIDLSAGAAAAKLNFKSSSECKGCEIWFADSAGTVISKQILKTSSEPSQIVVPKGAASFGVADPKSNFRLVPLPRDTSAPVSVEFSRKYSPLSDLRRGLGNYDIKSYDSNIQFREQK